MNNKHDYYSPEVCLQEQRDKERFGDDPRAYDKFQGLLAEEHKPKELTIYDTDPSYKYLNDNRIDHVLPNGIKVSYYNEGKFKK